MFIPEHLENMISSSFVGINDMRLICWKLSKGMCQSSSANGGFMPRNWLTHFPGHYSVWFLGH